MRFSWWISCSAIALLGAAGCREFDPGPGPLGDAAIRVDAGHADAAIPSLPPPDLGPPPNPGPKPLGGAISGSTADGGALGGQVDRLFFGFTGDTRPSNADDTAHYPIATINNIFGRIADADVQFSVDLGDHMYIVKNVADAPVQMGYYTDAARHLGARPLFMVLGNHDCGSGNCAYAPADANYVAYMAALKQLNGPGADSPFYSFTVATQAGPAVFVVISDNFTGNLFNWLEQTLSDADKTARYTIVMRHHPLASPQQTTMLTEATLKRHKYTLFLTGHYHHYERDLAHDPSGRTVVYGLGGVPNSGPDWGYGLVQQGLDDRLYVTVYDASTNIPTDSWSVAPQQ